MASSSARSFNLLLKSLCLQTVIIVAAAQRSQIAFPISPCQRKDGIKGSCTPRMVCKQFENDDPNLCFGYDWVCCPPLANASSSPSPVAENEELFDENCGARPAIDPRAASMPATPLQRTPSLMVRTRLVRQKPLVVGGRVATPFSWPWMVAVQHDDGSGIHTILCGGAVISKHYVLTAAHCFSQDEHKTLDPSHYSIRVGAHNIRQGTKHDVVRIVLQSGYVKPLHYNDIALLEVKGDLLSNSRVRPVCLPDFNEEDDIEGTKVTVTGWGDTAFRGFSSSFLREVTVPVVDRETCDRKYRNLSTTTFPRGITNNMICAGLKEGGKDACQGDSGGPLVAETSPNKWTIVGIVAFGYGCALPEYPGIYTRVSQYLDWIKNNAV